MKVKELQEALQDIAQVLEVAGTKTSQKDFQGVLKLLEGAEEQDLEPFLQTLEKHLSKALKQSTLAKSPKINKSLVQGYLNQLVSADMDEESFTRIAAELKNDSNLSKTELAQIASLYHARPANTITKLHKSIQTRFYERIYDRDATKMAEQATPW